MEPLPASPPRVGRTLGIIKGTIKRKPRCTKQRGFFHCARNGTRTRTAVRPRDFHTTLAFTQAIFERCCSLDYFFTMPCGLGVAYIVSTPFISLWAELSEPSPHLSSPTERFLFVRAILHRRFPDAHSCFVLDMSLSTRDSLDKASAGFQSYGLCCHH